MNAVTETQPYLAVSLGGHAYGLPLTRVREIVICRAITRFPGVSESLRGLMSLRGNVVPVVDLACHLGLGATLLSENTCAVLLDTNIDGENAPVGGLVEMIESVIELAPDAFSSVPEFGTPIDPRMLAGVTPHERGFVYLLDLDAILASLETRVPKG